jgi:Tfp pilus assembly protein PilZ
VTQDLENRDNTRIDFFAFLKVIDLKYGNIHKGRMFNFSKDGIYFESDSLLNTGTLVFLIVEDSPFASTYGILKYYRALVIWRKKLKGSVLDYGYGIQFKSLAEIQELNTKKILKERDLRNHRRNSFIRSLRVATRNGIIKGTAKNISPTGLFIATKNIPEVGQILKVALPLKKGKEAKITGRVIWSNSEGVGVKFLRID